MTTSLSQVVEKQAPRRTEQEDVNMPSPANSSSTAAVEAGASTALQRVAAGLDLRELPLVLVLAALLLVDGALRTEGTSTLAGIPAVALTTVPLLWRTSAPRVALVLTVLGVFACLGTLLPYDVVALPAMVAAYSVAVATDRLRSVLVACFVVLLAVAGVAVSADDGATFGDAVLNCVLLLLAVATGDAVRARRAHKQTSLARAAEQVRQHQAESHRLLAEERLRIAREVHDVVAHAMVAINVQAGVAAHVLERRPEQAGAALRRIKATSGAALIDLRETLGLLREPDDAAPTDPTGSLAQVDDLATPLRAAGIEVQTRIDGHPDAVPTAVGQAVYRIVQEASTNIMRHTASRHASITVEVGHEVVDIRVDDDGIPPTETPVSAGSGSGVSGMRERAIALGGSLDAGRRIDGGWRVHAVLPR